MASKSTSMRMFGWCWTWVALIASGLFLGCAPSGGGSSSGEALPAGHVSAAMAVEEDFLSAWALTGQAEAASAATSAFAGTNGQPAAAVADGTWLSLDHGCASGGIALIDTSLNSDPLEVMIEETAASPLFIQIDDETTAGAAGARTLLCCHSPGNECDAEARPPTGEWSALASSQRPPVAVAEPALASGVLLPLTLQVDEWLGIARSRRELTDDNTGIAEVTNDGSDSVLELFQGAGVAETSVDARYPGALSVPFDAQFELTRTVGNDESAGEGISFYFGRESMAPAALSVEAGRILGTGLRLRFEPGHRDSLQLLDSADNRLGSAMLNLSSLSDFEQITVRALANRVQVWLGGVLVLDASVDLSAFAGTEWGFSAGSLSGSSGYRIRRVRAVNDPLGAPVAVMDSRPDPNVVTWIDWTPTVRFDSWTQLSIQIGELSTLLIELGDCARDVFDRVSFEAAESLRFNLVGLDSLVSLDPAADGPIDVPLTELSDVWFVDADLMGSVDGVTSGVVEDPLTCQNLEAAPDSTGIFPPNEVPTAHYVIGPDVTVDYGERHWLNLYAAEIAILDGATLANATEDVMFSGFDGTGMTDQERIDFFLPVTTRIRTEGLISDDQRRRRFAWALSALVRNELAAANLDIRSDGSSIVIALAKQISADLRNLVTSLEDGSAAIPENAELDFERLLRSYRLFSELEATVAALPGSS